MNNNSSIEHGKHTLSQSQANFSPTAERSLGSVNQGINTLHETLSSYIISLSSQHFASQLAQTPDFFSFLFLSCLPMCLAFSCLRFTGTSVDRLKNHSWSSSVLLQPPVVISSCIDAAPCVNVVDEDAGCCCTSGCSQSLGCCSCTTSTFPSLFF